MGHQERAFYGVAKKAQSSDARAGALQVNGTEVRTPILWLGHRLGGKPRPWQAFSLPGVLVNAWQILSTGRVPRQASAYRVQECRDLMSSSPVLIDSGGYLYLRREDFRPDPLEILDLYEDLSPAIGAVLDCPLDPFLAPEQNEMRWRQTIANTRTMFEKNGHLTLMPVVHAHSVEQAKRACSELRQAIGEPIALGIGSLVPLMRGRHDGRVLAKQPGAGSEADRDYQSSRHLAVDIIRTVRAGFPNALLHVFGVGGTTTMHLMFAQGIDSLDSVGWRLKAAHGAIQLPGLGDRFTSTRAHNTRALLAEDDNAKGILLQCACPVCREHNTLEDRLSVLDRSFNNRASHNAWVFVQEAAMFGAHIQTDSVEQFVRQRLQYSQLKHLLPAVFGT